MRRPFYWDEEKQQAIHFAWLTIDFKTVNGKLVYEPKNATTPGEPYGRWFIIGGWQPLPEQNIPAAFKGAVLLLE